MRGRTAIEVSPSLHCLVAYTQKQQKAFDMGMPSGLLTVPRRCNSWRDVLRARCIYFVHKASVLMAGAPSKNPLLVFGWDSTTVMGATHGEAMHATSATYSSYAVCGIEAHIL